MTCFFRFGRLPLFALAAALCATGCHKNQDQTTATMNPANAQDQASDPASANMAPVAASPDVNATAPSGTLSTAPQQSAPPADAGSSYNQQYSDQAPEDPGYGEQPVATAPDPPPALPDYDQPPAPGDDYLWTPGYWAWAPAGYYWVPGVWVEAPYMGALWTPGYWGYWHNHYAFYRGYWGPHIGYYGGVNYGFGYVGVGYQGGYWNGGHFNYNRSVNNINVTIVHNVYNRTVIENRGSTRVSFVGGAGGLRVSARPAEVAALHETHAAPMRAQVQNEHLASSNRAQFASINHGRPASLAVSQPLAADRNVRAPAATQAMTPQRGMMEARPNTMQPAHTGNVPPAQPQMHTMQTAPAHQQTAPQQMHEAVPQRQTAPAHQQTAAPQHQPAPQHQVAPQHQPAPRPNAPAEKGKPEEHTKK